VECLDNLRQNLRRIRLLRGLTQQATAEKAGIEYKYFQNIEAGRWRNLTLSTLQKIADAVGVKPWELLCDGKTESAIEPVRQRGIRSQGKRKRKPA
jgi:transcriptional regulator with XRE-family HTH domain